MNAKEYLSDIKNIDIKIDSKLEEIVHLREKACKITKVFEETKVTKTREINKLENSVVKIVALEEEINELIGYFCRLKVKITSI